MIDSSYVWVTLSADVSGFTRLSESLSRKGDMGAEELGFYLNRYFERVGKLVAKAGGDIIKFAGDALLVMVSAILRTRTYMVVHLFLLFYSDICNP